MYNKKHFIGSLKNSQLKKINKKKTIKKKEKAVS